MDLNTLNSYFHAYGISFTCQSCDAGQKILADALLNPPARKSKGRAQIPRRQTRRELRKLYLADLCQAAGLRAGAVRVIDSRSRKKSTRGQKRSQMDKPERLETQTNLEGLDPQTSHNFLTPPNESSNINTSILFQKVPMDSLTPDHTKALGLNNRRFMVPALSQLNTPKRTGRVIIGESPGLCERPFDHLSPQLCLSKSKISPKNARPPTPSFQYKEGLVSIKSPLPFEGNESELARLSPISYSLEARSFW